MRRSAFRHKIPKEENSFDRVHNTHDKEGFTTDSLELDDSFEDEDAVERISKSVKDHESSPRGDHNRNLLGSISNPSLDHQLDDTEQNNFPYTEREIYEMQLVQLQEQLVAIMIQDQEKGERLKKYEELGIEKLSRELKAEQDKNAELAEKLKVFKNKTQNPKITRANANRSDPRKKGNRNSKCFDATEVIGSEDWVDVGTDINELDKAEPNICDSQQSSSEKQLKPNTTGAQEISVASDIIKTDNVDQSAGKQLRIQNFKRKLIELIVDRLWDFVNEEPESHMEESNGDDNGDPLAVKTLKENIHRFTNGVKPITLFIKSVTSIGSWSNPAASLIAFIVYMYAARYGYLFSFLLMLVVWKLFLNYLYARGFAAQIGFSNQDKDESSPEDKSWSDKFQLVLQVARKVQNMLGKMADSLEKIKNLLTWQHPATRTLFTNLCILLIASIVLNGPTLFMFMALGFGIKVFITGPLYDKFPKVKQRYDGVARIWSELPTDADLATKENSDSTKATSHGVGHKTKELAASSTASDQNLTTSTMQGGSTSWANFCERVKIPLTEYPLPTWEEGCRCTLMNKDKPLTNMKHGRLFLTQNFLCFERSKTNSSKNMAINLTSIVHVSKCKPIALMPGTGMAIEVEVKGSDKPYIFGALLGRDELFENLIMTGRAADLDWAKPR